MSRVARDLVVKVKSVEFHNLASRLPFQGRDYFQAFRHVANLIQVHVDFKALAAGIANELFRRGMRSPIGKRGRGCMHAVGAMFDGFDENVWRQAR